MGQQVFSRKSQIVTILGFWSHTICVATLMLQHKSSNIWTDEHECIPIKLYLQRRRWAFDPQVAGPTPKVWKEKMKI